MLCFRRLGQVKVTRMYVIISINYCLLTDMMVMSISHMGFGSQGPHKLNLALVRGQYIDNALEYIISIVFLGFMR